MQGERGPAGERGADGAPGRDGERGEKGDPGAALWLTDAQGVSLGRMVSPWVGLVTVNGRAWAINWVRPPIVTFDGRDCSGSATVYLSPLEWFPHPMGSSAFIDGSGALWGVAGPQRAAVGASSRSPDGKCINGSIPVSGFAVERIGDKWATVDPSDLRMVVR